MPPTDETIIGCLDATPRPLDDLAAMLLQDRAGDPHARGARPRVFRITTDTGASYIYLFAARVARTVERQALIDLDDNGNVVGVELPSVILPPAGDPHVGSPQAVETRAGEGRTPATSTAGGHEITLDWDAGPEFGFFPADCSCGARWEPEGDDWDTQHRLWRRWSADHQAIPPTSEG